MRREASTLLAGARVELDAGTRRRLAGPHDWRWIVTRSIAEGTAPLLHHHMTGAPSIAAEIPEDAAATLAHAARAVWARNTMLREAWREVVVALEADGLTPITLKGMALAHTTYPDFALRPMVDVDLVVPPAEAEPASAVLARLGYTAPTGAMREAQTYRGYVTFVRDRNVIDLRWYAAHYARYRDVVRLDHAGLFARSERVELAGVPARVLSTVDDVLYLALHLSIGSEFGRLIWFTDIDAVIRRAGPRLDWDLLVARAQAWRLAAVLCFVLDVLRDSFDTPMPPGITRRLDALPGRQRAIRRLFDGTRPPLLEHALAEHRMYLAEMLLMDRPADIARLAWNAIVPPAPWIALHYEVDGPKVGLYRVLHPFRVAGLAVRGVLPGRQVMVEH